MLRRIRHAAALALATSAVVVPAAHAGGEAVGYQTGGLPAVQSETALNFTNAAPKALNFTKTSATALNFTRTAGSFSAGG